MKDEAKATGGGAWKLALGCGLLLALTLAIAVPNVIEARKQGAEHPAIGALKTLSTAQSLFREQDRDQDGVLDYATLEELGRAGLLDELLAAGTKHGYVFECAPSTSAPEFMWLATARPVDRDQGERYFAVNHEGVTHYRMEGPIPLNLQDCSFPPDARPVGR